MGNLSYIYIFIYIYIISRGESEPSKVVESFHSSVMSLLKREFHKQQ